MQKELDSLEELSIRYDTKNGVKLGKRLHHRIPKEHIFRTPLVKENPWIFIIWHRRMEPAIAVRVRRHIIIINLYSLRKFNATEEEFKLLYHYLSSVMVEELSHCYTKSLKGHDKWIDQFMDLHEELD